MAFVAPSRRILVVKTRAIGDTVLLTGVLRVLREHKPHYKIDVLVRWPGGQLLEHLPYIDRVICVNEPKNGFERMAYWMRLVRRLRERRYEMVLNFHASPRTAFFAKLLRTQMVVANHHALKGRNWFSDIHVPGRGHVKSIIDRDLDVLRAIGIHCTPTEAMPKLCLSSDEISCAKLKLKTEGDGPLVFLGIGGSRDTKRWPAEHFIEMARRLMNERRAHFVLATTKEDRNWIKDFHAHLEKVPDLKKKVLELSDLTLREVSAVVSICELYIGNDSGVKHIAVAHGLPTFTFFGPELPTEWHPYDVKKHPFEFIPDLDCRTESGKHWCSISVCDKHGHVCMKNSTPAKVFNKVVELLGMKSCT